MIGSSRQCVWFVYGTSGAVVKQEVQDLAKGLAKFGIGHLKLYHLLSMMM